MPSERRNLRSNKETSSSTNGEKARSNSQSSNAKDKPVPTRSTSSKSKAAAASKKASNPDKDSTGSKPQSNGTEAVENGLNGTDDVDMVDEGPETVKANGEADEEMTVVVPPPRNPKLVSGQNKDTNGDMTMDNADKLENEEEEAQQVDPKIKAVSGTICCCPLLPRADHRTTRYQSQLLPP